MVDLALKSNAVSREDAYLQPRMKQILTMPFLSYFSYKTNMVNNYIEKQWIHIHICIFAVSHESYLNDKVSYEEFMQVRDRFSVNQSA